MVTVGGITEWTQIKNIAMSNTNLLAEVDAEYQSLRSITFDLRITIATALGRGQGDKTK